MPVLSSMTAVLARDNVPPGVPNQQPNLWAAQFVTFGAAVMCFVMRMTSRWMTRNHLWWDDWFAIGCFITNIAWMICMLAWFPHGIGVHIYDHVDITGESVERTLYVNKLLTFIIEFIYAYTLFFGKASILFFYWRMFKTSSLKLPIQILAGCSVIWIVIRTFMGIFHCVPVRAFWDANAGGFCAINDSNFFFGTTLTHVIIDLAILSLPVFQINQLQLPVFQKISVLIMFMFGVFICVAGIVLIVHATTFDAASEDFSWNIFPIILWATVEVNLVTVSACMPVCRPALRWILSLGGYMPSSRGANGNSSYGNSRSYVTSHAKSRGRRHSTTMHKGTAVGKSRIDADDSASTYELANSINNSNEGDFDTHALDGPHRTRVTVKRGHDSGGAGASSHDPNAHLNGINVKSETIVTSVRHDSPSNAKDDDW